MKRLIIILTIFVIILGCIISCKTIFIVNYNTPIEKNDSITNTVCPQGSGDLYLTSISGKIELLNPKGVLFPADSTRGVIIENIMKGNKRKRMKF